MDNNEGKTAQPCRRSDGRRSLIHHSARLPTAVQVRGRRGGGTLAEQTAVVRWWLFIPDDVFLTSHVHTRCMCVRVCVSVCMCICVFPTKGGWHFGWLERITAPPSAMRAQVGCLCDFEMKHERTNNQTHTYGIMRINVCVRCWQQHLSV